MLPGEGQQEIDDDDDNDDGDDDDEDDGLFPVCSNPTECHRGTEMPVG